MASFLVTGAGRGLGLAFVKELVSLPTSKVSKIIASVRKPSADLDSIVKASSGRVTVVTLDTSDEESIKNAVPQVEAALEGKGLDVLINNAGIGKWASDGTKSMETESLEESFKVNVFGVHWVTRNFLPLLQAGQLKKVANIGTTLGSITLAGAYSYAPCPAYKISKAAAHALTVQYALDYGKAGFAFIALSPGWLKTDLGGGDMADLTAEQGAKASLEIIWKPNEDTNGTLAVVRVEGFEDRPAPNKYDGKDAPW